MEEVCCCFLSISARCAATNKLKIHKTAINTKIVLNRISIISTPRLRVQYQTVND